MKTVGEDTFYMKCYHRTTNERTNERTNDRHRPMAIALGDFVTWAKNTSNLIQIAIPTIRNADLKLKIFLCPYF